MRMYQVEELRDPLITPTAVCLGLFDGVHLGHLRLIEEAHRIALEKKLTAIVHTYDTLPVNVISPEKKVWELTPLEEKIYLLEQTGIDGIAVSHFDESFQHLTGEAFFYQVLLQKLHARHIVAGFNHRFGCHGDTDIKRLAALCQKEEIGLSIIPPVRTQQGALISSSAIRSAILHGNLSLASDMLGRPVGDEMIKRAQMRNVLNSNATQSLEV